jgi:hypothetical protein
MMMLKSMIVTGAALVSLATAAHADFQKVESQADFVSAVNGKTLTRPMVKLQVSPAGSISGKGALWDVSGEWSWQGGYFCRSLNWGGDDLGYNCQEVKVQGSKIRFTSDKGSGDSADFSLQ